MAKMSRASSSAYRRLGRKGNQVENPRSREGGREAGQLGKSNESKHIHTFDHHRKEGGKDGKKEVERVSGRA